MRLEGKFAGWTIRIEDRKAKRLRIRGGDRPTDPSVRIGRLRQQLSDTDTALYLFADGRCLRRNVVQAHDPDVIAFRHAHESRDDGWYKTRLRFAPLSMTESVIGETRGSTALDRLGTVEIVFWQGRCKGEMSGPHGAIENKLDFGPVDELSKKEVSRFLGDLADGGFEQMIGHTVGAGESSLIEAPKTSFGFAKTNPLKADYRVVFHYRTRSLLMAEGVIERPVQPPRTDEYVVLFRKRKRGVRFDTLRSGSKAGTDLARKPKNLGAYRPREKVQFEVEPGIGSTTQGSEEFPIDLTGD